MKQLIGALCMLLLMSSPVCARHRHHHHHHHAPVEKPVPLLGDPLSPFGMLMPHAK